MALESIKRGSPYLVARSRGGPQTYSVGGPSRIPLDLRLALDELGKVVGAVVTDDILDRIFQRFCIGK